VAPRHEPRRGAVLDVPDLAVRAKHPQLSDLLARLQKRPPGRLEVHAGIEEVVEPATDHLMGRQAEQPASGGVRVDERPCIVDDEDGVARGGEKCFGLLLARHPD
jgi:hypothetical protein